MGIIHLISINSSIGPFTKLSSRCYDLSDPSKNLAVCSLQPTHQGCNRYRNIFNQFKCTNINKLVNGQYRHDSI